MADLSESFKRLESDPQGGSQYLLGLPENFFLPFVQMLDRVLDKRLVRTLLQCLVAILRLRNNPQDHCWFLSSIVGMHLAIGSRCGDKYRVRFLIRWVKNHLFVLPSGEEKKLWQIGQGKRYLAHKESLTVLKKLG
jgi:hypothetical protein